MSLQEDLEQKKMDTQIGIELFRITRGRLPNKEGDDITKALAEEFLNKVHDGKIKYEPALMRFAFDVYASTNLAYK